MPTLYVTEPGSRVEKDYHRLSVVDPEDHVLLSIPVARVDEVVLVGPVGITTQAMHQILLHDISLSLITSSGRFLGRLHPPTARNIALRREQFQKAAEPDFCLQIARSIVEGKLRNHRAMASRMCRQHSSIDRGPLKVITQVIKEVSTCSQMDRLRGLEGLGARIYFKIFRGALLPGWDSPRRSRRPPQDAFNALLSLGYTLLTHNMMTSVEIVGLDPYQGFFHSEQYSRPALALDLVEEFRSLIVDSIVISLINKKILQPDDFQIHAQEGCRLQRSGLKKFFKFFTKRLETAVYHPYANRKISYRKCFEVQARMLRRAIEENGQYQPFQTR